MALDKLEQPLPPKVKEVVDSSYLSKLSDESLEEGNEKYLEAHKDSAPHVQSAVRFRNILKPGAEGTKSKSATDLQSTFNLENTTLQQALEGLQLLEEIEADASARESYRAAAQKRWPEATMSHMAQ